MKPYKSINLGYTDAINFALRKEKQLLNNVFFDSKYLQKIASNSTYFVIGEKGTGKTTYAIFMANNNVYNTISNFIPINTSDYVRFYRLMKSDMLAVSKFEDIWTAILLQYTISSLHKNISVIDKLFPSTCEKTFREALQYYDEAALAPEKIVTREIIEENCQGLSTRLTIGNEIGSSNFSMNSDKSVKSKGYNAIIQSNINKIISKFKDILNKIKLRENFAIFIDGIDVRPEEMDYSEYIECINGLISAAWNLNNTFFGTKKDTKGIIRIALLLRPDIFSALRLHNSASKILDNSVYLNWETTSKDYRKSELFSLCEHILMGQQNGKVSDSYWDYYFPWKSTTETSSNGEVQYDSFVEFLRISYSRPRDLVAYLQFLQDYCSDTDTTLSREIFFNNDFRNRASEYLLQTIKDYTNIYISDDDFSTFRNFFQYLKGKYKFTWAEYQDAYKLFYNNVLSTLSHIPDPFSSENKFLQFLYNTNVIGYWESAEYGNPFMRWCYRERKMTNLRPIIPINQEYQVHRGLQKALNLGRRIR